MPDNDRTPRRPGSDGPGPIAPRTRLTPWILIALVVLALLAFNQWFSSASRKQISYTQYQQYVTDLIDNIKIALGAVDPTPFFTRYGNNSWAAVKTFQDAQVAYATAPVIQKYTGVLAAADVFTASNAFIILESIRLDLGYGSQIHP